MKKSIFSLMLGAIVALASCNKSDDDLLSAQTNGEQLATFTVEAPALTRATVAGLTRYIVEAYEGADLTTTPLREESATGSLTITLKKNTEYTFLFWADGGTAKTDAVASSGYWNTADLKAVQASANGTSTVAYCTSKSFNSKDFAANSAITLKNATAQVNFVESIGFTAADNTLTVKYAKGTILNVGTGESTGEVADVTHTFTSIAKAEANEIIATDYVLAPLGAQNVVNLKVQFNSETEKEINNVPFQQSYKTNIKGEYSNYYSSVFTISNKVEDYTDNEDVLVDPTKYAVGDAYPDATSPIGVVFYIENDGKNGKIVSLDEGTDKLWSKNLGSTGARNSTDGLDNMRIIKELSNNFDGYPVSEWVDKLNNGGSSATYAIGAKNVWYLPAYEELKQLYAAWNGDATTTANTSARAAFNSKLTNEISPNFYWSSTDISDISAWYVSFNNGNTGFSTKSAGSYRVRAVFAF